MAPTEVPRLISALRNQVKGCREGEPQGLGFKGFVFRFPGVWGLGVLELTAVGEASVSTEDDLPGVV